MRVADVEAALGVEVWRRVVVDPAVARAVDAGLLSGRLPPQRLEVEVVPSGGRVTVVVRFDAPTNVPIVGALVGDLALDAEATMRLER